MNEKHVTTTVFLKRIFPTLKWQYLLLLLLPLAIWQTVVFLKQIVRCTTDFTTTSYFYAYLVLFFYLIAQLLKLSANKKTVVFSLIVSLFLCEILLRFVIKYPLTYIESNGGKYYSIYCYQEYKNLFFKPTPQMPNQHLHRYEPFSLQNPADAEGEIRPKETTNALGLRGTLPQQNKKVVACLGDSFTESVCVTIDSSYPVLLEKLLLQSDTNLSVMNAGVSGSDPFFSFKLLRYIKEEYPITTAVFLINSSDILDVMFRGGMERFSPDGKLKFNPTPWWERLYAVSFVVRLVAHNLLKLGYDFHTVSERAVLQTGAINEIFNLFENSVVPYCKANQIQLIVALHPTKEELISPELYNQLFNRINQLEKVTVVNTYSTIKAEDSITPMYYPIDLHFYGKGYELVAKSVYGGYVKAGL